MVSVRMEGMPVIANRVSREICRMLAANKGGRGLLEYYRAFKGGSGKF